MGTDSYAKYQRFHEVIPKTKYERPDTVFINILSFGIECLYEASSTDDYPLIRELWLSLESAYVVAMAEAYVLRGESVSDYWKYALLCLGERLLNVKDLLIYGGRPATPDLEMMKADTAAAAKELAAKMGKAEKECRSAKMSDKDIMVNAVTLNSVFQKYLDVSLDKIFPDSENPPEWALVILESLFHFFGKYLHDLFVSKSYLMDGSGSLLMVSKCLGLVSIMKQISWMAEDMPLEEMSYIKQLSLFAIYKNISETSSLNMLAKIAGIDSERIGLDNPPYGSFVASASDRVVEGLKSSAQYATKRAEGKIGPRADEVLLEGLLAVAECDYINKALVEELWLSSQALAAWAVPFIEDRENIKSAEARAILVWLHRLLRAVQILRKDKNLINVTILFSPSETYTEVIEYLSEAFKKSQDFLVYITREVEGERNAGPPNDIESAEPLTKLFEKLMEMANQYTQTGNEAAEGSWDADIIREYLDTVEDAFTEIKGAEMNVGELTDKDYLKMAESFINVNERGIYNTLNTKALDPPLAWKKDPPIEEGFFGSAHSTERNKLRAVAMDLNDNEYSLYLNYILLWSGLNALSICPVGYLPLARELFLSLEAAYCAIVAFMREGITGKISIISDCAIEASLKHLLNVANISMGKNHEWVSSLGGTKTHIEKINSDFMGFRDLWSSEATEEYQRSIPNKDFIEALEYYVKDDSMVAMITEHRQEITKDNIFGLTLAGLASAYLAACADKSLGVVGLTTVTFTIAYLLCEYCGTDYYWNPKEASRDRLEKIMELYSDLNRDYTFNAVVAKTLGRRNPKSVEYYRMDPELTAFPLKNLLEVAVAPGDIANAALTFVLYVSSCSTDVSREKVLDELCLCCESMVECAWAEELRSFGEEVSERWKYALEKGVTHLINATEIMAYGEESVDLSTKLPDDIDCQVMANEISEHMGYIYETKFKDDFNMSITGDELDMYLSGVPSSRIDTTVSYDVRGVMLDALRYCMEYAKNAATGEADRGLKIYEVLYRIVAVADVLTESALGWGEYKSIYAGLRKGSNEERLCEGGVNQKYSTIRGRVLEETLVCHGIDLEPAGTRYPPFNEDTTGLPRNKTEYFSHVWAVGILGYKEYVEDELLHAAMTELCYDDLILEKTIDIHKPEVLVGAIVTAIHYVLLGAEDDKTDRCMYAMETITEEVAQTGDYGLLAEGFALMEETDFIKDSVHLKSLILEGLLGICVYSILESKQEVKGFPGEEQKGGILPCKWDTLYELRSGCFHFLSMYRYLDVLRPVFPKKMSEFAKDLDDDFLQILSKIGEEEALAESLKQEIMLNRRYVMAEGTFKRVDTGGFLKNLFITEYGANRVLYAAESSNGYIFGIYDIAKGRGGSPLFSFMQATSDNSRVNEGLVSVVLAAYRDITVPIVKEHFYDEEKHEKAREVTYSKGSKKKVRGRKVIYMPRKIDEEAESGIATARMGGKHLTPYTVVGHLRRLHEGWHTSEDAHGKAESYGMIIPDGFTFVEPHRRGGEVLAEDDKTYVCWSALDLIQHIAGFDKQA